MRRPLAIALVREPDCQDIPLPAYASDAAAGMDLRAALREPLTLAPGERAVVRTGLRIALPEGFEAQIRPRSGLAAEHGITVVNSPGTIDPDYRGEVCVPIINLGHAPYTIQRGERIAQMIVAPFTRVVWEPVAHLDKTNRAEGGFGHTGRT